MCAIDPDDAADWTVDHETGRSNSSPTFLAVCRDVEMMIRQDAHNLLWGHANVTARLIVARLAHHFGLVPMTGGDDHGEKE